eukprot:gene9546-10551_t
MIAKLAKLEHKLGHIEIEDLQHLDVESSDSFYAEVLDVFLDKYAQSFKIREVLGETRETLILTLIRKLEIMTDVSVKPRTELKFKVLQNICDSLRVCLRDAFELKQNQIQYLLKSLLHLILHFQHYGHSLSLSATRCLVNVLNKHPGRIQEFISPDIQGYAVLANLIQNDDAVMGANEQSQSSKEADQGKSSYRAGDRSSPPSPLPPSESKESGRSAISDGKKIDSKGDKDSPDLGGPLGADEKGSGRSEGENANSQSASASPKERGPEADLTLVHYCVKVLYMLLCQSEDAHKLLRGNVQLITASTYRLARCLLANHHQHLHLAEENDDLANPPPPPIIQQFPYNEPNALLYIDLCKLLYILDVYGTLEEAILFQRPIFLHPSLAFVRNLQLETVRYPALFKELVDSTVQSIDEISIRVGGPGGGATSRESSICFHGSEEKSVTVRGLLANLTSSGGGGSGRATSTNPAGGGELVWNPLTGLPAIEVLNTILLVVLTVSPVYLRLLYRAVVDVHQNSYYTGKLADCEEASLQLLLLASEPTLRSFCLNAARGAIQGDAASADAKGSDRPASGSASSDSLSGLTSLRIRRTYLTNSLVRILNRVLLNGKTMEASDKCAYLTPILIVLSKVVAQDSQALAYVKHLIFPNPYPGPAANTPSAPLDVIPPGPTPASIARSASKDESSPVKSRGLFGGFGQSSNSPTPTTGATNSLRKTQSHYIPSNNEEDALAALSGGGGAGTPASGISQHSIDPKDCPVNTLRYELINLMTSLDTQIKRIVAEFLFALCQKNVNEFVYRTGFGNSVALLQLKGLV